jgi:hypothetical protein
MSKYEPLESYLKRQSRNVVELSFSEIERIIGAELPPSAYTHRAMWSNNPVGHVMTQAWLAAGFESENVDMDDRTIVFRRTAQAKPMTAADRRRMGEQRLAALHGCLKGTVHIPEGVDITEPVALEWDAMRD